MAHRRIPPPDFIFAICHIALAFVELRTHDAQSPSDMSLVCLSLIGVGEDQLQSGRKKKFVCDSLILLQIFNIGDTVTLLSVSGSQVNIHK